MKDKSVQKGMEYYRENISKYLDIDLCILKALQIAVNSERDETNRQFELLKEKIKRKPIFGYNQLTKQNTLELIDKTQKGELK